MLLWPLAAKERKFTGFIGDFYWFVRATFRRQLCQENTAALQRRGLREARGKTRRRVKSWKEEPCKFGTGEDGGVPELTESAMKQLGSQPSLP